MAQVDWSRITDLDGNIPRFVMERNFLQVPRTEGASEYKLPGPWRYLVDGVEVSWDEYVAAGGLE